MDPVSVSPVVKQHILQNDSVPGGDATGQDNPSGGPFGSAPAQDKISLSGAATRLQTPAEAARESLNDMANSEDLPQEMVVKSDFTEDIKVEVENAGGTFVTITQGDETQYMHVTDKEAGQYDLYRGGGELKDGTSFHAKIDTDKLKNNEDPGLEIFESFGVSTFDRESADISGPGNGASRKAIAETQHELEASFNNGVELTHRHENQLDLKAHGDTVAATSATQETSLAVQDTAQRTGAKLHTVGGPLTSGPEDADALLRLY